MIRLEFEYNEDEARDEHGRWTAGGEEGAEKSGVSHAEAMDAARTLGSTDRALAYMALRQNGLDHAEALAVAKVSNADPQAYFEGKQLDYTRDEALVRSALSEQQRAGYDRARARTGSRRTTP